MNKLMQLPDDVVIINQYMNSRYKVITVYDSPSNGFQGTKEDFFKAGLAYKYSADSPPFRREGVEYYH